MSPAEALVLMTAFLTIGGVMILRGPLGRALADRIASRHRVAGGADTEEAQRLDRAMAELDEMRHRVAELEERQDFAERLLAAHRQPARQER